MLHKPSKMGASESKVPQGRLEILKHEYEQLVLMNHEFHEMLMEKLRVEGWYALDTWPNMTRIEQIQFRLKMRKFKEIQTQLKSDRNRIATILKKHGIPAVTYA